MKAAQGRSYHLEVFVDIRIFEVVHFVYHSYGALDMGKRTVHQCLRPIACLDVGWVVLALVPAIGDVRSRRHSVRRRRNQVRQG